MVVAIADTNGKFEMSNLPGGNYFVTPVRGDWTVASLERLAAGAPQVKITGGEQVAIAVVLK